MGLFNEFCIVLLCTASVVNAAKEIFEQAHLSFSGDDSTMVVDFVSTQSDMKIEWRASADDETTSHSQTTTVHKLNNVGFTHNMEMPNLSKRTLYSYRACTVEECSDWVEFITPPYGPTGNGEGEKAAVFADFGMANDISMDFIVNDPDTDYMIHVGDFAYDFEDDNSENGNKFMNTIGARTKSTPYMPAVGNHELHNININGTEYVERFRGVSDHAGKNSKSLSNFYYSYDRSLVHYIVINTEIYRWPDEVAGSPLPHTPEEQLAWLEEDLKSVNREVTPWVVAMGHKAWYMSSWGSAGWEQKGAPPQTNWTAFEPLFCQYGVDLYLSGHVHLYQRFYPLHSANSMALYAKPYDIDMNSVEKNGHIYRNPKWMTTLIVASPGDDEISNRLQCAGLSGLNISPLKDTQALCTAGYGYGHLTAVNSTHMHWQFYQTGKAPNVNQGDVGDLSPWKHKILRDELWLIMDKHGYRDYCGYE